MYQQLTLTLHKIGAVQFGEFKLKSGAMSPIYINLRKIISYPTLLREIADLIWEKVKNNQFDLICGVPYTALPIATCISLEHNIPMVMRRKEKKDYGTKQMIEGVFAQDQRCLIVEDLITTGSSIIETADELEHAGLKISDVVALIDREQGGIANLNKKYQVHTILKLSEIMQTLLDAGVLPADQKQIVEKLL